MAGSALQTNQDMLDRFLDKKSGGFYSTPEDGEDLIVRKKELYDGAMPSEIVIVGKREDKDTMDMIDAIRSEYLPRKVVLLKDPDDIQEKDFKTIDGKTTAYVCSEGTCNKPTTELSDMMKMLKKG